MAIGTFVSMSSFVSIALLLSFLVTILLEAVAFAKDENRKAGLVV
jgi:hypothetical protein